jgi:hypothetical protein
MAFHERAVHQLAFHADFGDRRARPGFYLGIPLDNDVPRTLPVIFGINLRVNVGRKSTSPPDIT